MKETIIAEDKAHLEFLIKKEIKLHGNTCHLNHINTSKITDMGKLFFDSFFNGDISKWDVSNVEYMSHMFYESVFNRDISKWNTSKVINMNCMFDLSKFNQDISNWDVSNVKEMINIFSNSEFNKDLTIWKPINLQKKYDAFYSCNAPIPYWAEVENTPQAVNSYWLNKELESSLVDKNVKSHKIKI